MSKRSSSRSRIKKSKRSATHILKKVKKKSSISKSPSRHKTAWEEYPDILEEEKANKGAKK